MLFDVVSGEKYFLEEWYRPFCYPNIAAFEITKDTRENIREVFSALSLPWVYYFWDIIDVYTDKLITLYEERYITYYKQICEYHKQIEVIDNIENFIDKDHWFYENKGDGGMLHYWINQIWSDSFPVVLYGCGELGKVFIKYANMFDLPIKDICVSDGEDNIGKIIDNKVVLGWSDVVAKYDTATFIIAVKDECIYEEIYNRIKVSGNYKILKDNIIQYFVKKRV